MERAEIHMNLTPDGSGLWLSLFNNEGKNQAVFFDLEKRQGQAFSFTDRTIMGNITLSSLVEKRLFYPAAGKDGKIFAHTDRNTLDLPIELFALADANSVTAGFRPWLQVLPGDEEFLFLAPLKRAAPCKSASTMWQKTGFSPGGVAAPRPLRPAPAAVAARTRKPGCFCPHSPWRKIELTLDRRPATLLFWDDCGRCLFLASTGLYYACLKEYLSCRSSGKRGRQGPARRGGPR